MAFPNASAFVQCYILKANFRNMCNKNESHVRKTSGLDYTHKIVIRKGNRILF